MGYVQAGYSIVLAILFLYGMSLLWRRRRLARAVERVVAASTGTGTTPVPPASTPTDDALRARR